MSLLETCGSFSKLGELRAELNSLINERNKLGSLTLEDYEDCNDRYQAKLELGYEIDGLRDEIKAVEREMGD